MIDTFVLVWCNPNGSDERLIPDSTTTLGELGLSGKRQNFLLSQKDGIDPVKSFVSVNEQGDRTNIHAGESNGNSLYPEDQTTPVSMNLVALGTDDDTVSSTTGTYGSDGGGIASSSSSNAKTEYVGLVNQAMTCYLNSLLQTLYMTPEFRNAIYRWRFDGTPDEESRSIPFQLQKLFANLQTSTKDAVETTDVTKSFGWTSSDAWQQHDIQELCRVMFDALEKKFKGTDQDNLIKQLYEGEMQDYVKCLECGHESARTDTFLDVPLVIKPFGASKACGSVEEALKAFATPETLDESNQYMCDKCDKKVDAHKGLKFLSFPYLLTLQLKRFDFDYTTMHRIKLNDRVTFPHRLDLSNFIGKDGGGHGVASRHCDTACQQTGQTPPSAAATGLTGDDDVAVTSTIGEASSCSAAAEGQQPDSCDREHHAAANEKELASPTPSSSDESSPAHEYELFSIMVHSGSASGGHYYAYIRSFKDGEWYSFNDTTVKAISDRDIESTFGSGTSSSFYSYSSMYRSSANAYMLMYRQVNAERNAMPLETAMLPEHVTEVIGRVAREEEEERIRVERERSTLRTRIYYDDPGHDKLVGRQIAFHNELPLGEALVEAHKLWQLDAGIVPLERCRLVKYDSFYEVPSKSLDHLDVSTPLSKIAATPFSSSETLAFMLEARCENEEFEEYQSSDDCCFLKIFYVDLSAETVTRKPMICADLQWTVHDLRLYLAKKFKCSVEGIRLLADRYYSAPQLMTKETSTLKALGFYVSNKIYVSAAYTEDQLQDVLVPYETSRLQGIVDTCLHTLLLTVTLPSEEAISRYRNATVGQEASQSQPTSNGNTARTICLAMDNRKTISDVKEKLSEEIQLPVESFKLHRAYGTGQEFEVTRPTELLTQYDGKTRIRVSLGRALRIGEYRVKVHLFQLDNPAQEEQENGSSPAAKPALTNGTAESAASATPPLLIAASGANGSDAKTAPPSPAADEPTETTAPIEETAKATAAAAVTAQKPMAKYEDAHESYLLCTSVVSKGMTVLQLKKNILNDSSTSLPSSMPRDPSRLRLRKRCWKYPATVLLDTMKFEEDISVYTNWDVFLQVLPEPECMTSSLQTIVFVRRWRPSSYSLGPWKEIVLHDKLPNTLKDAISVLSAIPAERVKIARGRGSFPCDTALLDMPDQDWDPDVRSLGDYPVNLSDDGVVFFYCDSEEKLQNLSDERRKDIQKQDTARFGNQSTVSSYYFREKALKIYTSVDEDNDSR
eukprot:scpid21883/ scgid2680/ Ubiquitin carboxyl-terminal hydrolase 47; Deubiquitinating enzyme 47; Ubiquitin thioesterase 47; Ubiquitin-specific-processing protease 47